MMSIKFNKCCGYLCNVYCPGGVNNISFLSNCQMSYILKIVILYIIRLYCF